jgi:ketosteroid isomerase-like protein
VSTTPEQNIQIVQQLFDAVEAGDIAGVAEVCADPFLWHYGYDPTRDVTISVAEYSSKHVAWKAKFAEGTFHSTVDDVFAAADKVCVRYNEGGVMVTDIWGWGPSTEIPELRFSGIGILRIEDGKVVEEWFQSDLMERLREMGKREEAVQGATA